MRVRFAESNQKIGVKFSDINQKISADFGEVQTVTEYIGGEPYKGEYNVAPSFEFQELATKNKVMTDNMTIEAVSVKKISNTSGGNTVIIGG